MAGITPHTYVNATIAPEENCAESGLHPPTALGTSNPEPRVLLDHGGVKFTLGPMPVQEQQMAKKEQQSFTELSQGQNVYPGGGLLGEFDTVNHSNKPKESPMGEMVHQEHLKGSDSRDLISNDNKGKLTRHSSDAASTLPPVWECRKPCPKELNTKEPKTVYLDGHSAHLSTDPSRYYVNTESAARLAPWCRSSIFSFDLHWPGLDPHRQLHYVELDMEGGSGSSSPATPSTPTTPPAQAPSRRSEQYTIIDVESTVAMANLHRALPPDDGGGSRKTRHNSNDPPV